MRNKLLAIGLPMYSDKEKFIENALTQFDRECPYGNCNLYLTKKNNGYNYLIVII